MKAIEITSPGEMKVVDRPMPVMGADDILLKMQYVGFCGSDLSTYLGKNPLVTYPRIPGHEISGVIEQTGMNVPASFQIGQHATVIPYTNCGQCTSCKRNKFNACRYNQTLGVQRDGAMSEYIAAPWRKVLVDEVLNERQLALIEPLTVGFHAVENGKVTDQDQVLVLGCGMIGSGAIIRARLRGALVIAVDLDDTKLEIARKLGASEVVNAKKQNLHDEIDRITNGNGASVVIEAAGNAATYRAAIEEVAFGGRVVCIGYAGSDVPMTTRLWVQKELEILGSRNANPADFEAVIKFLKKGELDEEMLISAIVDPENAPATMKKWADTPEGMMKILVRF